MNLYQAGKECVAWHSDNEAIFQGMSRNITIVSLLLGTSRVFEVRRKANKADRTITQATLDAGDIVVMKGWFQKSWQHRLLMQIDLGQAPTWCMRGYVVENKEQFVRRIGHCFMELGEGSLGRVVATAVW